MEARIWCVMLALLVLGVAAAAQSSAPAAAEEPDATLTSEENAVEAPAGPIEQIRRYYAGMPPQQRYWTATGGLLTLTSYVLLVAYGLFRLALGVAGYDAWFGPMRAFWLKINGALFVIAAVVSLAVSYVFYQGRLLQPASLLLVGILVLRAGIQMGRRCRSQEQASHAGNAS